MEGKVKDKKEEQVASGKESEFWSDPSPDGKSILYQTNSAPNPIQSVKESSIIDKFIERCC